ncbi:MAG: RIP metalloprotease RseP [Ruminococcaceae bacterium]|nr:RIP metalloprotease RseP [Oscillospiraceae bacterium]MBQ1259582.1 site-2 protease family protein [Clostridia bacterium]
MYIILTILMFGLLILFHELGHFATARLFKVTVNEFAIGMGPKLISKKSEKSGITYSLRALPIGGYVSMEGENEDSEDPNAYSKKPVWQRMIILVAGATMNIIIAIVLMFAVVISSENLTSTRIGEFTEGSVSNSEGGLMLEDTVVKVGWVPVYSGYELVYEISNQGTEPVDITVIRNGEKIVLKDVKFGVETEEGVNFGTPDFRVYALEKTFFNCIKQSVSRSVSSFKMIIDSLSGMLTGKYGMDAVQGPVGITDEIHQMEKENLMDLSTFGFLASVISMNLGIFNLLPIPALDGGQLVFRFIELIIRRPLNPKIEGALNFIMLIVLMTFAGVVMLKDIVKLIL